MKKVTQYLENGLNKDGQATLWDADYGHTEVTPVTSLALPNGSMCIVPKAFEERFQALIDSQGDWS